MTKAERAQLEALRDKFVAYKTTSHEEAHREYERRRTKSAYGRACEAATLGVIVTELNEFIRSLEGVR